ncbi:MAG TPA: M64 family metallopeptidase [Candidatus Acidoferrum sp.]|nr:M64 family metallopeptidase [Candidatus Acidoferrum sp.]
MRSLSLRIFRTATHGSFRTLRKSSSSSSSSIRLFRVFRGFPFFNFQLSTFCFLLSTFSLLAQPSLTTILSNGPASNRFNIVFLSEGYTSNQVARFQADATNALNALLARPPYQEYRPYFNAFAIAVASVESGSDHASYPQYRNTYFNSTYDPVSDYYITIPPNFADGNYNDGQGKIDALLQTLVPSASLSILLVNDLSPGGSDGGLDKTAITYTGAGMPDILAHETGHVVAGLGDEYTNAYPGYPAVEEPNTTQETRSNYLKWRAWIPAGTPVPTPPTAPYAAVVGFFQGAHYNASNWFRPKLDCCMNHPAAPFCEVCSEAMVLSFYRKVRPVDAFSPLATSLSVSSTQALAFNLSLLQPASHGLSVQWFADGLVQPGATGSSFAVLPQTLGNGPHSISAGVRDNTTLVRDDPANVLTQTVAWNLNVNIPSLWLDSPTRLAAGRFAFRLTGNAPQGFVLQTSTDLVNWTALATNNLTAGQFWFTNSGAAPFPGTFYRAKTPP